MRSTVCPKSSRKIDSGGGDAMFYFSGESEEVEGGSLWDSIAHE